LSPELIRLVVMTYVRYPLSLRNVEDLLYERGIDICHETVRLRWNRFGPIFAAETVGAAFTSIDLTVNELKAAQLSNGVQSGPPIGTE
jgi:transposase-like protein